MYTIGQVSEMFDLPISTLRYYDKQGLFPEMTRVSGIRTRNRKDRLLPRKRHTADKSGKHEERLRIQQG